MTEIFGSVGAVVGGVISLIMGIGIFSGRLHTLSYQEAFGYFLLGELLLVCGYSLIWSN